MRCGGAVLVGVKPSAELGFEVGGQGHCVLQDGEASTTLHAKSASAHVIHLVIVAGHR